MKRPKRGSLPVMSSLDSIVGTARTWMAWAARPRRASWKRMVKVKRGLLGCFLAVRAVVRMENGMAIIEA